MQAQPAPCESAVSLIFCGAIPSITSSWLDFIVRLPNSMPRVPAHGGEARRAKLLPERFVELTFLGTGSAFTSVAYNAAMLVDRELVVDAGAPLLVHLARAGSGIEQVRGVVLTHFHLDHTVGLISLLAARAYVHPDAPPLQIAGPPGVEVYVRKLIEAGWGINVLKQVEQTVKPTFREVEDGQTFELAGFRLLAHAVGHLVGPAFGYVVERNGHRLGYSGDSTICEGLERLVRASDSFVVEMTSDFPVEGHISRPEALELVRRHPNVRFIVTHRSDLNGLPGATLATDFLTLQL